MATRRVTRATSNAPNPIDEPLPPSPVDPTIEIQAPEVARNSPPPISCTPFAEEPTTNLMQAILLMTEELRRRERPAPKAKAKEPDTFDGSDPKKLNNFILLCNLYFRSSSAYDDNMMI